MTNPATETKSEGKLADAPLSWFMPFHLDSFIMQGQLLPIYRDSYVKQLYIGEKNPAHLTGLLQQGMPTPTQTATPHTPGPL